MRDKGGRRARLFMNGGSQAVRLPKEFRFEGNEVLVRREGQMVILEPVGPQVSYKEMEIARKVIDEMSTIDPDVARAVRKAIEKVER